MDFTFSEEQEAFRAAVRGVLADLAPSTYVREMLEDEVGCTRSFWSMVGELGWAGLLVPVEHGGGGFGLLEAAVVCEEMGRLPLPGPWLSSAVAGVLTARALGDVEVLGALAGGSRRATLALEETGTRDPLDPAAIGTTADARGRLTGVKPLVLDGRSADVLYVVARDAGGLAAYAVDRGSAGVSTELVPTMDVTRKAARVALEGAAGRRVGPAGDQTAALRRVVDDLGVALCAESVGACDRALQMATDYAKARVQFGRPIATFQVIKHKIVDMLHQLELARVATHYAAWASSAEDPAREASAAMAKGFVAEAATMITGQAIQVHGGVGFTWDVDCHLLFRRVKANDLLFGRQAWQRQRLADLILDGSSA